MSLTNTAFLPTPYSYALQLAEYLKDVSTISARTKDEFGRSPPDDVIAKMIGDAQKAKAFSRRNIDKDSAFNDNGAPFRVKGLVTLEPIKPIRRKPEVPVKFVAPVRLKAVTATEVIAAIAADYGFTASDLIGGSRRSPIMRARRAAAYALKQRGSSYPRTGELLGGRDHSSAINLYKRFETCATEKDWAIVRQYLRGAQG